MSDRPTPTDGLGEVRRDVAAAADTLRSQAGAAAETVRTEATSLASEVAGQGREAFDAMQQRAEGAIEQGKAVGAEQAVGLARAIRHAADDLEGTSPEIAQHVRAASDAVHGIAGALRDRSAGELFDEVTGFARRQPAVFFGAAALVGFALARFAKSSTASGTTTHAGSARHGGAMPEARPGHLPPGWTPDDDGRPTRPATMAAASLGGAAAHRHGAGLPGSMPTLDDGEPAAARAIDKSSMGAQL